MKTEDLKILANSEIDRRGNEAIGIAKDILSHPEPGFREHRTSRVVGDKLKALGVPVEEGIGITGLRGIVDSGRAGPTVAVIGELDSLIVPGHPNADLATGAAHACGHHCQIGSMIASVIGLLVDGVMDALSGRVAFLAVPSEEYIEIEYRDEMRRSGKIEFLGGKPEFIRLGKLDDVDMAMMTHTIASPKAAKFAVGGSNNGMLAKRISFIGTAAHAGAAPYSGVNALNAAMIAMSAINAQRETYRDEDTIRVHPIITKGGAAVSSVPADVRMETFVRGSSVEAFMSASRKVDRALRAGAIAVGGSVRITTLPGYMPIRSEPIMLDLHKANAASIVGNGNIKPLGHRTGSTDMGDVSQIMPVIHPYVVAASGKSHGDDYVIEDYDTAVLTAGKAMAMTVIDLLADGASKALEVRDSYQSPMSKSEYLSTIRNMTKEETFTE